MTVKKYSDTDQAFARYVRTPEQLEQEAMTALKSVNLGELKETVFQVPGDVPGVAKSVAEAVVTAESPLRERLLSLRTTDLEDRVTEMQGKIATMLDASKHEVKLVDSAELLGKLRDAAREEKLKSVVKALVDAVNARGITYGEWRSMLDRMATLKGADISMVSNRDVKEAIQKDLVKLFYEPLVEELANAKQRLDTLKTAFPEVTDTALFERVALMTSTRAVLTGLSVFREGETSRFIGIVVGGKAHVEKGGTKLPDVSLGPGSLLGLHSLAGEKQRKASIIADEPLSVIELPMDLVKTLAQRFPALGTRLAGMIGQRKEQLSQV